MLGSIYVNHASMEEGTGSLPSGDFRGGGRTAYLCSGIVPSKGQGSLGNAALLRGAARREVSSLDAREIM